MMNKQNTFKIHFVNYNYLLNIYDLSTSYILGTPK